MKTAQDWSFITRDQGLPKMKPQENRIFHALTAAYASGQQQEVFSATEVIVRREKELCEMAVEELRKLQKEAGSGDGTLAMIQEHYQHRLALASDKESKLRHLAEDSRKLNEDYRKKTHELAEIKRNLMESQTKLRDLAKHTEKLIKKEEELRFIEENLKKEIENNKREMLNGLYEVVNDLGENDRAENAEPEPPSEVNISPAEVAALTQVRSIAPTPLASTPIVPKSQTPRSERLDTPTAAEPRTLKTLNPTGSQQATVVAQRVEPKPTPFVNQSPAPIAAPSAAPFVAKPTPPVTAAIRPQAPPPVAATAPSEFQATQGFQNQSLNLSKGPVADTVSPVLPIQPAPQPLKAINPLEALIERAQRAKVFEPLKTLFSRSLVKTSEGEAICEYFYPSQSTRENRKYVSNALFTTHALLTALHRDAASFHSRFEMAVGDLMSRIDHGKNIALEDSLRADFTQEALQRLLGMAWKPREQGFMDMANRILSRLESLGAMRSKNLEDQFARWN